MANRTSEFGCEVIHAKPKVLYLIGSLRNDRVPKLAATIRSQHPDIEVFDDWFAAGPEADDHWKAYEQARGSSYQEALEGYAARNVFAFDRRNLDRATHAMLVLPAGKSGHMEIMYATYGVGAKTAILLDPEDVRWDVMYQFVPTILNNDEEISEWLNPSLQVLSTTEESRDLNLSPGSLLRVSPTSWASGRRSTQHTTGGEVSNTPGLLEHPFDTSTLSTTAKTKTRRVR